jgi:hypothetical protein
MRLMGSTRSPPPVTTGFGGAGRTAAAGAGPAAAGTARLQVLDDVALGDAPALAGALDRRRIEPVLLEQAAHGGAQRTHRGDCWIAWRSGRLRSRPEGRVGRTRRLGRESRRALTGRTPAIDRRLVVDARDHVTDLHGLALLLDDVHDAGALGR